MKIETTETLGVLIAIAVFLSCGSALMALALRIIEELTK
jgi:hypothetical protein